MDEVNVRKVDNGFMMVVAEGEQLNTFVYEKADDCLSKLMELLALEDGYET